MSAQPESLNDSVGVTAKAVFFSSADSLHRRGAMATRLGFYRTFLKRSFDVFIILLAAPLILPVIGIFAILVTLQGGKPFYTQDRVGRGGRIYTMWKLRSMICNADEALEAYLDGDPDARAEWDCTQKLKNDPRITGLGRILRKSSMDELPQLWNVLKGDMSLVGPRPMMPEQQAMYPGTAYFKLRPGITGPWQVSERNETAFADRAVFDTYYDQTLAFGTDIKLLAATVGVVLRATGH